MLYLGVDLGGTNIKAALVNSEGEILCEANTPTNLPRPAEAVCDDIAALCLQLAEGKDVAGVGVGCPGTVDGGTVLYSNNLDWHDFAMEEYLAQKTGLPVAVGNDANVAALGEALAGCAKGAQSTVVVTLGTGVGAGVVLDGKLLTGYTGAASEAGHMVILDTADAPRCTCGRHGCLEALASATALIRMTKEARLAHPESALNVLAAKPEDVRIIHSPVGMPGRALNTPLVQALAQGKRFAPRHCARCLKTCDPAKVPYCITHALIEAVKGNVEEGLFFCGANVGRLDRMYTVRELMDELTAEWRHDL